MQAIRDLPPHGGSDVDDLLREMPLSEVVATALADSTGTGARVIERGELVGYLYAVRNPDGESATVELAARGATYRDVLVTALQAIELEADPVLWVHDDVSDPGPAWTRQRTLWRMAAQLPVEGSEPDVEGLVVRGFQTGDEEALLAVNNAAFEGHPEQGGWTKDDLAARFELPWFDPEGIRMIWSDGLLAAFHWTKVHEVGVGEVFVLAVSPAFAGRGIGRFATLEGLRHLHEDRGCDVATLYVDADNTRAVELYESFGFTRTETHRAFESSTES